MSLRSIATLVHRTAFFTICLCLSVNLASAATATWDGGGGDNNFRTPANWAGDIAPSPGDIIAFDGEVRLTPNNNYVAGTQFGGIVFTPTVAGPFTINGSLINLNGNITDSTQSFTNTINLPLALQTTPTINITSFGSLALSSNVSGSFGLNETGNGLLTLSGGNTFTGPVTIGNGATLSVGGDANLGAVPASATPGNIVLNGGATLLTTGSNFTLNANRGIRVVNNGGATPTSAMLNISTGQSVTYNGVIADNATAGGLTKLSFGNLSLGGANTYTGPTTVGNGLLTLDFTQSTAPTSNIISSASSLNIGTAAASNAGLGNTSNNRLTITGKSGANNVQSFNGTNISLGPAIVQATNGASGNLTVNLGALTHTPGGVASFILPTSGAITTTTTTTNGILGGWATISTGNTQNGVIQSTDLATVDGTGRLVAYNGYTDYSTAVAGDTGGLITAGNPLKGNITSSANLRVNNGPAPSSPLAIPVSSGSGDIVDINTISMINGPSGGNTFPSYTIVIGNNNTLRLGKFGGIFRQDVSSTSTLYIGGATGSAAQGSAINGTAGTQNIGVLTAGGPGAGDGEIVFNVSMNAETTSNTGLFVEAQISDNPSGGKVTVVKTGAGPMKLDGHNTFSGGLYIESGRLQFAGTEPGGTANPDGGGTGPIYVFPGAQLFPSGAAGTIANNLFLAGTGTNADATSAIRIGTTTLSGTVTLTGYARIGGGGTANGIGSPNSIITGQITGGFGFDIGAEGNSGGVNSLTLTNLSNNYTGNTTILGRTGTAAGNTFLNVGADQTTPTNGVIPHGIGTGNVILGITGDTASQEALNLNGHSTTINGLAHNTGTITLSNLFVENDSATNATLTLGDNNQTATFGGIIRDVNPAFTGTGGGTLALTKIGSGTQTLASANTYSGPTNINNGALSITGSLNSSGIVNVNTSATASGTLYGNGSIGTVTAAAANGSQKVIINPGATGAGTFGTLTMASATIGSGTDLQFDLQNAAIGASDQLSVSGLTLGGPVTVSPSGTPVAGDYVVVQSSGPITGSALSLNTANDTRLTFGFAPTSWNPGTNANSTQVVIRVTGQSAHLLWSGAADGSTWDLKTTQNWKNSDNANAQDKFFNGDFVTFDDTGAPNFNISLGGIVQPGSITVNNSAGDYAITGGGSITGGGTLVKNGSRALTISTNNSYSGGATLNAGTLNVNNNGALGVGALTINGGILGNTSGQTVTLTANPAQNWNADVTFNGPSDLNLGTGVVTSTVTGGTVRTVTVNGGTLTVGGTLTDTAGTNGLTKAGAGTLVLGAANNFSGPVNINGGTVKVNDFGALGTNATPGTTIAAGATLDIGGPAAASTTGFGAMPFSIAGSGVGGAGAIINSGINAQQNAFQNISLAADATVGGTGRFDIRGGTPVLNLNGHTLTKVGTNQFSLVGAAVNSGNIVVNQGTFSIEAATVIDNTVPTDTITVNTGATLQFFANNGTVSRPIVINGDNVTINDGSGAAAVSTIASPITAKGNLTFTGGNATANLIMNGAITQNGGARSLTKSGASQLTLGATTNTYTGGTNLNGGTITFNALGSLGTGPLTFNGGTLQYGTGVGADVSTLGITVNQGGGTIDTNGNVVALTKNITGPGGFGVKGNSTVLLTGTNTYAGPTTVQNGFLIDGSDGAIPNNTSLVLGNTNNDNATFDMNGRNLTVSGLTTVANSSGNLTSNGPGNLTVTYNGTSAGDTFNANISNGTAQSIALALNSGQLSLGGSNSYTGTTKVNNSAKLFVNGSHFGGGAYTVASGATLGGIGSTDAAVTVASGGTLSPGAASGLGTLTIGSATIAGTLQIRINDADAFLNGSLTTNAALALQSATLNFNITGGAFQPVYLLAHYGSLTGNPFANVVGLPANYTLNYNYLGNKNIALVSNFPAIQTGDFNRDGHTNASDVQAMLQALTDVKTYQTTKSVSNTQLLQIGDFNADGKFNNLDMQSFLAYISTPANNNVAPVPEPASFALLAFGGLGLAEVYRRRRSVAGRN